MSTKTKDKKFAEEIAAALQADVVRNKFNIPAKYKAQYLFTETFQEYLKTLTNSQGAIEKKKWHYKCQRQSKSAPHRRSKNAPVS